LDEKWAFVDRKQKHCDLTERADHHRGDCWDHVAYDPEHRLVLAVVCGKRSGTRVLQLMRTVKRQLQDRTPLLITSDEYASYATALRLLWAPSPAAPDPPPGRKRKMLLNYATVCKRRANGRVVEVNTKVVFGTRRSVAAALKRSSVSRAINTSFLERHNGTDRHRNARKARRTYRFSKDWEIHQAVTHFSYYTYNFCWCVRTLRLRIGKRRYRARTPAMSAELSDHVWSLREWLSWPIPGLSTSEGHEGG
jgi:IS1 family transposase